MLQLLSILCFVAAFLAGVSALVFGAWFFFMDSVEVYRVIRVAAPCSLLVCIAAWAAGARLMKLGVGER